MAPRKRSQRDGTPPPEIVTSDPVLIGEPRLSPRHNRKVYQAVDYLGTRFRIGDHVALYSGEGRDWVCVLEMLFIDDDTGKAMFRGRWFFSVDDVHSQQASLVEPARESRCAAHELITSDQRDNNLVESISRKCIVLNWDNFQLVRRAAARPDDSSEKVYYCDRQFYHKAGRFGELNSVLFPGNPIPKALRKAAGLPEVPLQTLLEDHPGNERAYREPQLAVPTRRRQTKSKATTQEADPILIW